jgi:hypothetical protein
MREVINKKALEVVAEKGKNVELAPAQDTVLFSFPFYVALQGRFTHARNAKVQTHFLHLRQCGFVG